MLGPHLHPQNLGWKAVDGKLMPMQCDMDVAPKALLKVVRCNCKMGCDTLRCSCRVAKRGWNVPLAVESAEASVLICTRTKQRTTNMRKTHKLSCCLE